MPRRIFEPSREVVTEGRRKQHKEELQILSGRWTEGGCS
jgi:hypothetical protein